MNQESSRSHSIFVIEVTQKNVESGSATVWQAVLGGLGWFGEGRQDWRIRANAGRGEEDQQVAVGVGHGHQLRCRMARAAISRTETASSRVSCKSRLGGNSRTTLIINCSPSSYNDAETISTLRFGERAKTIKQKAKINEELSPAQLKALCSRKRNRRSPHFESYVSSLEGEISTWRRGESVPKEQWTPGNVAIRLARRDLLLHPEARRLAGCAPVRRLPSTPRPESRMELERVRHAEHTHGKRREGGVPQAGK